jgi:hypothetical protein
MTFHVYRPGENAWGWREALVERLILTRSRWYLAVLHVVARRVVRGPMSNKWAFDLLVEEEEQWILESAVAGPNGSKLVGLAWALLMPLCS